jgi:cold shock CspA family protein
MTGTVLRYRDERRFGFVKSDDQTGEFFFLQSDIQMRGFKTVNPGDRVTFDLVKDDRKPGQMKAANICGSLAPAMEAIQP